jgi:hypothetical protein
MRNASSTVIFTLAALAMLGACKKASSESPPELTAPASSALPAAASSAAAEPTAGASAEPSHDAPDFSNIEKDETGCPATVEHPGAEGEIVGSWKEVLARLKASAGSIIESPWDKLKPSASDAEIRRALTGKPDGAASVWLIPLGLYMNDPHVWHVVGKRSDGKLALFLSVAAKSVGGPCPGNSKAVLETRGMPRLIVEEELQQPVPAGQRDVCSVATYVRNTIFLDVSKPDIPLAIEQRASAENDAKPVWVEIAQQKDTLKITGAGCNLEESLRP